MEQLAPCWSGQLHSATRPLDRLREQNLNKGARGSLIGSRAVSFWDAPAHPSHITGSARRRLRGHGDDDNERAGTEPYGRAGRGL